MIELQKWHNNLEVSLMNGSPKSPLSLKELYEDQARRDSFLKEQVASLAEKYEKVRVCVNVYEFCFASNISKDYTLGEFFMGESDRRIHRRIHRRS